MEKIIRVDMDTLSISRESETELLKPLGGRGLTSTILSGEVSPNCDPLGRENKIVIAPGVLTGSSAPCSGRLSIGAKSPLKTIEQGSGHPGKFIRAWR